MTNCDKGRGEHVGVASGDALLGVVKLDVVSREVGKPAGNGDGAVVGSINRGPQGGGDVDGVVVARAVGVIVFSFAIGELDEFAC